MASVNRVTLLGHLGKDPEVRSTNSGSQIVSFSLATSESWRDKNSGDRKEKTEWHNVVIFNEKIAKVAEAYCKKGSKIYLEGKIRTRKWQDKDGADRYTTEIVLENFNGQFVLLDGKNDGPDGDVGSGRQERASKPTVGADEEIPF